MSLSGEEREEIARLVGNVADLVKRQLADQRREYVRLSLMLLDCLQQIDADLRPCALALLRRGVLSDADVETARDALAADLATSPRAGEIWQAVDELRRLADQLGRAADQGT